MKKTTTMQLPLKEKKMTVPRYRSAITLPACHLTPMFAFSTSSHIELFYSSFHQCATHDQAMINNTY